jgi:hypothetical protein
MPIRDPDKRREYERERKQKRRLEKIMSLPETEQIVALSKNERRRSYSMRWIRQSSNESS